MPCHHFHYYYLTTSRHSEYYAQIKVDKEFISNIEHSKEVQSVFEALLKIAHTQNLEVVAEGVETIEQKHILKKMKCDQIQGYLLSKPLPLNEFHTWRFEGG